MMQHKIKCWGGGFLDYGVHAEGCRFPLFIGLLLRPVCKSQSLCTAVRLRGGRQRSDWRNRCSGKAVQHGIEDVEIAQLVVLFRQVFRPQATRDKKGHALFVQAAVRPETMARETGQIVFVRARSDNRDRIRHDYEVPLAIEREAILLGGSFGVGDDLDPGRPAVACMSVGMVVRSRA